MKTLLKIFAGLLLATNVAAQTLSVGNNQTLTISSNATYTALTLGNNSTLIINNGVTLTINGNTNATNGGTITIHGTLNISGTLSAGNNLSLNIYGNFTAGGISVNNNSSLTVSGTGNVSITNNFTAGNNTNIDINLGGIVNVGGNMNVGGGTSSVNIDGSLTISGTYSGPTPTGTGYMADNSTTYLGSPLPVTLLSFDIKFQNNQIVLYWNTATEQNNDRFEIYRSNDMINWQLIAKVAGSGNSNSEKYYSYTDDTNLKGLLYYRLEQVDYNGTREIIAMKSFNNEPQRLISIYPNPVQEGQPWKISGIDSNDNVMIFNSMMQPVDRNNLRSGVYLVVINNSIPIKLIVK
ncbi:MAG TPA: hypothetical protein PK990_03385 [Salinivirgaceae bacterium]|nr:hypothetical protein [Salinivirgaceae bacterium]